MGRANKKTAAAHFEELPFILFKNKSQNQFRERRKEKATNSFQHSTAHPKEHLS